VSISSVEDKPYAGSGSSGRGFIKDESLAAKILETLRASGDWVPARELSAISLQYCARIAHLRRLGHKIENKLIVRDGVRFGFYRLAPPQTPAKKAPESKSQGALFRNAVAYRDPEEAAR
jgi:hypothetical protein